MLDHLPRMASRTYESTCSIDFAFLHRIRVREEFFRLTGRVGFTAPFWTIQDSCPTHETATIEFLSSLCLMEDDRRGRYIKFKLGGATRRVTLDQLREWFHLHPISQTDEALYRGEMIRDNIFQRISGRGVGRQEGFKSNLIIHPVLRCIQRILGHMIYARDESIIRVTHEDLQLIDTILLPDHELQQPDLMQCMVRHWLGPRINLRSTDIITMGSYVTYINHRLGTQFGGEDICKIRPSYGWQRPPRLTLHQDL
jgi:ATHILA ORF-1 family